MFEKDAEEYVIKKHNIDITKQPVDFSLRCEFAEDFTDFQKGAEFGYNAANEWNYPSKGEYPKENKRYLCKIKAFVGGGISYECFDYDTEYSSWRDAYGDVIAWKEIVLPKEIGLR